MENTITNRKYTVYFCFILLIAVLTRILFLEDVLQGLHIDEAGMAYDAFCLANYGCDRFLNKWPVYLINYQSGQSALYAYCSALLMKIIGINYYAIRLPAAISGIATVICGTLLVRDALGKKWSLLAMLLLAICPYFIMASRFGFDCNLMLGCTTLSLYAPYVCRILGFLLTYTICSPDSYGESHSIPILWLGLSFLFS